LYGRGLYDEEENFLKLVINEYNNAGLSMSPEMAQFKSLLADCMLAQQNLDKVRPLLADVLRIRDNQIQLLGGLSSSPVLVEPIFDLIKSLLKLAEFDRDQSNFQESKTEFARAKQLLDRYAKDNVQLNQEYTMSTADLQRQIRLDRQGQNTE
jgi:hypothetical protein